LHESQAFPRYLTATGLLEYYGAMTGVSAADLRLRIPRLLERVGLTDRTCEPISGFSKGMVQRLALAQALVNEPELLVLDEPTEGMDLVARQLLHEVIRHRQQQGRTAILVSHSLSDVEQLCDRVAVLRAGELAFTGTLSELAGDESAGHLEEALEPLYAGAAP
jgi:ABC-2 type transport system ATP-binding protein